MHWWPLPGTSITRAMRSSASLVLAVAVGLLQLVAGLGELAAQVVLDGLGAFDLGSSSSQFDISTSSRAAVAVASVRVVAWAACSLARVSLRRQLSRARTQNEETSTDNTLIRVAIGLLLSRATELRGNTEVELRESLGLPE